MCIQKGFFVGVVGVALGIVAYGGQALGNPALEQCKVKCKSSSNFSQCVEDCYLSSKKGSAPKVETMAPGKMKSITRTERIDKGLAKKLCKRGWMWSPRKQRCIPIGPGSGMLRKQ